MIYRGYKIKFRKGHYIVTDPQGEYVTGEDTEKEALQAVDEDIQNSEEE